MVPTQKLSGPAEATVYLRQVSFEYDPCGRSTFHLFDLSHVERSGYMLERSYWGNGYASEALRGFLETYWKTFPEGYPRLEGDKQHFVDLHIVPDNAASLSVARKCGFTLIGQEEVDNKREEGKILVDIWRSWRPGHELVTKAGS